MAAVAVVPKDIVCEPGTSEVTPSRILPAEDSPVNIRILPAEEAPTGRPSEILFGALRHPDLRLRRAIPLRTEEGDGTVCVVWDEVEEFGYGNTLSEAIYDFGATITELFFRLSEHGLQMSEDLLKVRNKLSQYIEPRQR